MTYEHTIFLLYIFLVSVLTKSNKSNLEDWQVYKTEFELKFEGQEDEYRHKIFLDNMFYIKTHNAKNLSFKLGINQFAHLTLDEYRKFLMPVKTPFHRNKRVKTKRTNLYDAAFIDWRTKGVVTPVKNQLNCSASYAFASIGSMEAAYKLKTGKLISLSAQNIVDCSDSYGNYRCLGGFVSYPFDYVRDYGINSEKDYPYTGTAGPCWQNTAKNILHIVNYTRVNAGHEEDLTRAVMAFMPVAVLFDGAHRSFQLYSHGIYYEPKCSLTYLFQGGLVVGIGSDPSPYYLVKNSWGTKWGMDGYIMMSRNRDDNCGIAESGFFASHIN